MTEAGAGLRLKVLAFLVLVMFSALTTRLWYLQVLAADQYGQEARENIVRIVRTPAPRGRILDRNGTVLVGNKLSLEVFVNRQELGDDAERVISRLARLLDMPVAEIVRLLNTKGYYGYQPVPIATHVPEKVAALIAEHQDEFPGVTTERVPIRVYPEGKMAAHVLGYVGPISEEQLERALFRDYDQADVVGKAGVELVYEEELQGEKGVVKYRVNAAGENLGLIGPGEAPAPGHDLLLSIDAEIQRLAEESLLLGMRAARDHYDEASQRNLEADAGAVVVLDPGTGEVIAMASAPTYHPSIWVRGFTEREYHLRFEQRSAGNPLINRAIQGTYPPGSTYKPFIALSAFRRKLVYPGGSYACPSRFVYRSEIETRVWNNWSPYDQGTMSMREALVRSCDTVFYPLGKRYWEIYYPPSNPPREPLQDDLNALGFGRETRVDLPNEYDGRVPNAEWKAGIHERYPELFPYGEWFPGDFINMSIGQGDTLVTPLQLAAGFAAIQNGGRFCVPHVGLRIQRSSDGKVVDRVQPRCRKLPFSPSHVAYVRDALADVVQPGGTAGGAFAGFPFSAVHVGGKTGTAELQGLPPKQDFSWFAATAEAGGEEYVIVALVEQGGHGSTTAAPVARRIIEGIFGLPMTTLQTYAGTDR